MRGLMVSALLLTGCVSTQKHRAALAQAHERGFMQAVVQMKEATEKALQQALDIGQDNEALRDVNAQLAAKCAGGKLPPARACKKGLGK